MAKKLEEERKNLQQYNNETSLFKKQSIKELIAPSGIDEAARLYSYYLCDALVFVEIVHLVANLFKAFAALKQCCNVSEVDSLFRPIWYTTQIVKQ